MNRYGCYRLQQAAITIIDFNQRCPYTNSFNWTQTEDIPILSLYVIIFNKRMVIKRAILHWAITTNIYNVIFLTNDLTTISILRLNWYPMFSTNNVGDRSFTTTSDDEKILKLPTQDADINPSWPQPNRITSISQLEQLGINPIWENHDIKMKTQDYIAKTRRQGRFWHSYNSRWYPNNLKYLQHPCSDLATELIFGKGIIRKEIN